MNLSQARFVCAATFGLAFALAGDPPTGSAETAEQIIAAAKKEGDEIVFVAGSQTFGGKKGLTELEAAFNKKFRLTARVQFAAGPQMSSMAARLITEAKAGGKSSTDFFSAPADFILRCFTRKSIWRTSTGLEYFPG